MSFFRSLPARQSCDWIIDSSWTSYCFYYHSAGIVDNKKEKVILLFFINNVYETKQYIQNIFYFIKASNV